MERDGGGAQSVYDENNVDENEYIIKLLIEILSLYVVMKFE